MNFQDDFPPDEPQEKQPPVEIPVSSVSPEALQGIIQSFVMREGTDYGREEMSFEKKIQNLTSKLEKGEIHLVFDPNTESVTFLTSNEWKKVKSNF